MKESPFLQVLKINDFLKLWTSQLLSQVTINMVSFVIILRIFEATRSTVAVSLVWFFYAVPAIFLGPFSGTIIDTLDKRKVLIWTNILQALTVLAYLLVKQKIWPIYTIIFLYSLLNQLYLPSESATLPAVVPKKLYPPANSIFMSTAYTAVLIGFSLAGPLVRLVGKEIPFLLSSLFLGIAALSVALLSPGVKGGIAKIRGVEDFLARVKEGYLFIRGNKGVLFPLILIVLSGIVVGVLTIVIPLYAAEILLIDLRDAGLVLVSPVGLGAVVGVAWAVRALGRRVRKKTIVSLGLFLSFFSLLIFSLLIPYLRVGKIFLSLISAFILGLGCVFLIIPSQTMIQEVTPKKLLARVYGVLGFMITLAAILPVFLTATLADFLGVTWILLIVAFILGGAAVKSLKEPYVYNTQGK